MILKDTNTYCYGFKIRLLGFSEINSKTTFGHEKFETEQITQWSIKRSLTNMGLRKVKFGKVIRNDYHIAHNNTGERLPLKLTFVKLQMCKINEIKLNCNLLIPIQYLACGILFVNFKTTYQDDYSD